MYDTSSSQLCRFGVGNMIRCKCMYHSSAIRMTEGGWLHVYIIYL